MFSKHKAKIGVNQAPYMSYDYDASLNMHNLGPGEPALTEWLELGLPLPDLSCIREYRLQRVREQLRQRGLMGALLYDPLNIRYASDSTNMQLWVSHNAARYCFVATEGPVIVFDYHDCEHLNVHNPLIDEVRVAKPWFYFALAENAIKNIPAWGDEIVDLIHQYGGSNKRIAIDRINPEGAEYLQQHGVTIANGEEVMENARLIKSAEEIKAMRCAIAACEKGMCEMYSQMHSGMTENHLWSILHAENIKRGGEWIETRILASGARTNPWFQESSSKPLEKGEFLGFDTDLIGNYGMCVDLSRTWIVDGVAPTAQQQRLFDLANEQITTNMQLLRNGLSYREFSERAFVLPPETWRRYGMLVHGAGLCDEYPSITFPDLWDECGCEGCFQTGMVVCVESYIGAQESAGVIEGIKLEEQVLITDDGFECLSNFPLGLNPLA